jgi:chromate transporter
VSERAVPLTTIASEWGRVGTIGFGGPPTHIALLRRLCVERRYGLTDGEFEDGLAAVNLLPGPASTQLAIYLAWRLRGIAGALLGGACFICPGLVLILALAALFLDSPAHWVRGAGAGAGAAVAAVAVNAGLDLLLPAWRRVAGARRWRLLAYAVLGGAATALIGPWLVLALAACGLAELMLSGFSGSLVAVIPVPLQLAAATGGGLIALAWVAFKVGALSYGGGFVIVPLMQGDAVNHYHWVTGGQFLNAVALGQITPGPVVQTVAVVGYAAAGVGGGLLAALRRVRTVVLVRADRRRPLPAPTRQRWRSRVPRRRRPGGDRGDPRLGDPARPSASARLAVPAPCRRSGQPARRPPRSRRHAARGRRGRRRRRAARRAGQSMTS